MPVLSHPTGAEALGLVDEHEEQTLIVSGDLISLLEERRDQLATLEWRVSRERMRVRKSDPIMFYDTSSVKA